MRDKRGNLRSETVIGKAILPKSRRAQVTIFVIIAIVIVASVALFFIFRSSGPSASNLPESLQPAYNAFLTCLEDEMANGIDLIETQGGYIDLPDFEPGSSYMPFSSQLNFLGVSIPYWYYVSGNNFEREQVPSLSEMQEELGGFMERRVSGCEFDDYYEQGFEINQGSSQAGIVIRDSEVQLDLGMDLEIVKNADRAVVGNHRVVIETNLGKLYDSAKRVYDYEQESLFLENYGVDTLRAYAPVDDVEVTCSPKIWNADEVFADLGEAIEVNTLVLDSRVDEEGYFEVDLPVDSDIEVRFLNSRNWTKSFEVAPNEGNFLISKPVGNQPGLGILGFCYVPYHFVYNLKYPVLIQVQKDDEIFQFPIAVIIQGNQPREASAIADAAQEIQDFCEYKNTPIQVNTYSADIDRVDADISYECANTVCYIGRTQGGTLNADFPQCVNGRVVANNEGYAEAEQQFSTIEGGNVDVYLDKIYTSEIRLFVDGQPSNKNAVITFYSIGLSGTTAVVAYPEQETVELSQGDYDVQVYIYDDASLTLGASVQEQCVTVPRGGVGGLLGFTEEQCFDVEIPETVVSSVLSGGGQQQHYLLSSTLERTNILEVRVDSLPTPQNLNQLQTNYILFENKGVDLDFR